MNRQVSGFVSMCTTTVTKVQLETSLTPVKSFILLNQSKKKRFPKPVINVKIVFAQLTSPISENNRRMSRAGKGNTKKPTQTIPMVKRQR